MEYIHLNEVSSTNSWILEQLAKGEPLADESVVWSMRQTAGRGQVGNGWESEPDKNISFSVLLKPSFLAPRDQFVVSEMAALAVSEAIPGSTIKWPNDIYIGDEKVCGILIENQLQGMIMAYSVLGIGINVNQEHWIGNAPNPTSIKLATGKDGNPEEVLHEVAERIGHWYHDLAKEPEAMQSYFHRMFCQRLYRGNGFYPYVDAQTGEAFQARISGVSTDGPLKLCTEKGEERSYYFKEVKFVLPCGVTKE